MRSNLPLKKWNNGPDFLLQVDVVVEGRSPPKNSEDEITLFISSYLSTRTLSASNIYWRALVHIPAFRNHPFWWWQIEIPRRRKYYFLRHLGAPSGGIGIVVCISRILFNRKAIQKGVLVGVVIISLGIFLLVDGRHAMEQEAEWWNETKQAINDSRINPFLSKTSLTSLFSSFPQGLLWGL